MAPRTQQEITQAGNPRCPQGADGAAMLRRCDPFNPTPEEFFALLDRAGFCNIRVNRKAGTTWSCVEGSKVSE